MYGRQILPIGRFFARCVLAISIVWVGLISCQSNGQSAISYFLETPPDTIGTLFSSQIQPFLDSADLRFEKEIHDYEILDSLNGRPDCEVLFTGSSTVRKWDSMAIQLAPAKVINRGFGGSTILQAAYYAERIIVPYHPKLVVIYSGENDIAWSDGADSLPLNSFRKFQEVIHYYLPDTRIVILSMKPSPSRKQFQPRFASGNELLKNYAAQTDKVDYIDITEVMLDASGTLKKDIFLKDQLHLNAEGYRLWASVLQPQINSLLAQTQP